MTGSTTSTLPFRPPPPPTAPSVAILSSLGGLDRLKSKSRTLRMPVRARCRRKSRLTLPSLKTTRSWLRLGMWILHCRCASSRWVNCFRELLTHTQATLQLAEQFGMDLDFFFSEATQPLTISSRYMGLDRYSNESELFSIFCVIATTTCEAFANVPASAPVAVNGSRADRSESVKVKPEPGVPGSVRKRRAPDGSGRAGSSRPPRASLSLSAQPPPMVTVVGTAAAAVASQAMSQAAMSQAAMSQSDMSQGPSRTRNPNAEPLFLPSQTQRMTQQEVLDMAGMGDIDLEAMMDDADAEDAEESRLESGAPADWDEVEFQNLRADLMSTQQNTDPGTSQRIVSPLRRQTQAIDLSDTEFEPNTDIFGDTTSISPVKTQRRSRSRSKSRQRERSRSRTQENSPPPGMDAREELDDDDEFEADEFDPTQPSGRKVGVFFIPELTQQFESFFTD